MNRLVERVARQFRAQVGAVPDVVAQAPGRVNLIGDHTDYNDGFVLPMAIGRGTAVAARRRTDARVRVIAADFGFAESGFELDPQIERDETQPWSNYLRGIIAAMQHDGLRLGGMDLLISGTIPQGSGLSSSASLCVAGAKAVAGLFAPGQNDPIRLALLAQRAENDFVEMRCGNMDQLASTLGMSGHALLIDCRSLVVTPISIPAGTAILIVQSGVARGLVDGAYNERRAQCEAVARQMSVRALRDVSAKLLDQAEGQIDSLALRRARHVVTENDRTLAAAQAMATGDLRKMGQLMAASHASLRDDFEVSVPAVDRLVSSLQDLIGANGGARMTGGGFGGAVVALMPTDMCDTVARQIREIYRTPNGKIPTTLTVSAVGGASIIGTGNGVEPGNAG